MLQAAGLLFFAFAGYARIATLGEEVRDPERTIPLAIPIALGITLVGLRDRRGCGVGCSWAAKGWRRRALRSPTPSAPQGIPASNP